LTGQDFPNYSATMDAEILALEERIRQAVDLCQRLRSENRELRQRVAQLQNENRQLADKITSARERLEGLLEQIPE
jgi:cell division protein ZapB